MLSRATKLATSTALALTCLGITAQAVLTPSHVQATPIQTGGMIALVSGPAPAAQPAPATPQPQTVQTAASLPIASQTTDDVKPIATDDGLPYGFVLQQGTVSSQFIEEIERDMADLPRQCVEALARRGYKIELAHTVTEAVPAAKNQQVRGYEPHSTWDSVFGMFNRTTGKVVMAEYARTANGGTGLEPGLATLRDEARRKGILRHEFGHAVDHYLGSFSHTQEFRTAYRQEAQSISKEDRQLLNYYLQPGDAGPEETFAELFASLEQTACDQRSDVALHRYFPTLSRMIGEQIAQIK